jgi:peroxin-16
VVCIHWEELPELQASFNPALLEANTQRDTMGILQKYEKFILENSDSVGHMESLIRATLFLVPGRFTDSELTTEFAYTGVGLLSLYHDIINAKNLLKRGISKTESGEPVPPPYSLNLAKWISFFQSVELLMEVFSTHKFGEKGKWTTVFLIEMIKTILRFKLLLRTNGNIIVHQHIPSRDGSSASKSPNAFNNVERSYIDKPAATSPAHKFISPANGKNIRKTLLDFQEEEKRELFATNTLMSLLPPPPPPPPDMVRRLLGESLYIMRPLIYLIAMYIYGKNSWRPWLLSLGSDIASWWCLAHSSTKLIKAEQDEVRRRSLAWLYYCVRSPFFEKFIGDGVTASIVQKLNCIPVVRVFLGTLIDYLLVYRNHYFYTSAS